MKKRIFTGLVLGAMMMGALTGCGEAKDVEQSEKKSVNKEVVETMDVEVEDTEEVSIEVTTEASVNVQAPEGDDTQAVDQATEVADVADDTATDDAAIDEATCDLGDDIVYNLGHSSVFGEDEIKYGLEYVVAAFGTYFPECELLSVTYDDGFSSSQDEINKQQYGDADYVVFTTDFTVPADYADGPLNAGETYQDYQWILTMNDAEQWELVSSGWQ